MGRDHDGFVWIKLNGPRPMIPKLPEFVRLKNCGVSFSPVSDQGSSPRWSRLLSGLLGSRYRHSRILKEFLNKYVKFGEIKI